jgi:LmbE family N-acetylglucosaminyl deacetylase
MTNFFTPKSVMVIMAHPDDIEFSCAGTIARWVRNGAYVVYVLCTSGEVGIAQKGMNKEKAREIREVEQHKAAEITGVKDVVFLRNPDGMLEANMELRKKLVREIRRFKPELIVCSDPTVIWAGEDYINHPDHRAAAIAAIDATFPAAGQPNLFEELESEGLYAHKPRKVYVSGWNQTDLYVNIDDTIETKINALRAHTSQLGEWDPEPRLKEWAAERAKGKEMSYAESFRVVTLVDDEEWEKTHGRVLGD